MEGNLGDKFFVSLGFVILECQTYKKSHHKKYLFLNLIIKLLFHI